MKRSAIHEAWIGAVVIITLFSASLIAGAMQFAQAQPSGCEKVATYLEERKSLVDRINKLGKEPTPKAACSLFGKLVDNGNVTVKWLENNKDWCQIPDQFIQGLKDDHDKAKEIRGQACKAAAQQAELEKRAREEAQVPMLGGNAGDPVTGQMKIPQGAL